MRSTLKLLAWCAALALAGCSGASRQSVPQGVVADQTASAPAAETVRAVGEGGGTAGRVADGDLQQVSLSQAEAGSPAPAPVERKIIRNAQLTVEVERPAEAMRRVASLAETRGGFVVTSESRQQTAADGVTSYEVVTVEVRVPAAQFDAFVGEVRGAGSRVVTEKVTGQDVTEEYIDLEARIRTQKELEAQFLVIMKSANKVSDALEVQTELSNVRTEIERLEGRRRFLENQTSLSTIKVTLRPPAPLVSTTGFSHSVRSAFGDGIDAAAAIILVLIRVLIALVPVLLFIVLPLALLVRFALRRLRRRGAALT